jgi:hypothetical protein
VSERAITPEMLATAARLLLRPGISKVQAVVLAFAELDGRPLDPERFDDSAMILRCERLLDDGVGIEQALRTAHAEHITWAAPAETG